MSVDDPQPATKGRGAVWLTRFFALIGCLGMLAIIFLAVGLLTLDRPYQPAKVAGAADQTMFTLRNVNELHGTNFLQLDIAVSEAGPSSAYGRGRGEDTRNILLLDKVTGISRKLLPDNSRRIDDTRYLSAAGDLFSADGRDDSAYEVSGDGKQRPPVAYYMVTVRQAADQDLEDVLVGTLSTGRQAYVMRGIEGVDSVWMHSPTQIGMIVRERLNLYHRIVDIPSLKIVRSTRIAVD